MTARKPRLQAGPTLSEGVTGLAGDRYGVGEADGVGGSERVEAASVIALKKLANITVTITMSAVGTEKVKQRRGSA